MSVIYKVRCAVCNQYVEVAEVTLDCEGDLFVKVDVCPDCIENKDSEIERLDDEASQMKDEISRLTVKVDDLQREVAELEREA